MTLTNVTVTELLVHKQSRLNANSAEPQTDKGLLSSVFHVTIPITHCRLHTGETPGRRSTRVRVFGVTYRVFELLADGADDWQRLLQLRGQLICVHVSQSEHVTHLQPGERT